MSKVDIKHLNATGVFLANHTLVRDEKDGLRNGCAPRAAAGLVGFWLAGYEPEIYLLASFTDGEKGDIIPLTPDGQQMSEEGTPVAWKHHFVVKIDTLIWDPAIDARPIPIKAHRRRLKVPRSLYANTHTRPFLRDNVYSVQAAADVLLPAARDGEFALLARRDTYVVPVIFD